MLERPDIRDEEIAACLRREYGLQVVQVAFLPLGADLNTAVYRVEAKDGTPYFLKLRRGDFSEAAVAVPKFLSELGIAPIIAPLPAKSGKLWTDLQAFKSILYPFVEGRDGIGADLSESQWIDFGAALQRIHMAALPPGLASLIPHETYSAHGRDLVRASLEGAGQAASRDSVADKLAAFLNAHRAGVLDLVGRAGQLAAQLRARSPEFALCHSDIHEANVLIDAGGRLYIVDWDNPIFAPRERDLMFIGGGICGVWTQPRQAALFYRGYGEVAIDPAALAYYRYERIVQDIAVACEAIFLTPSGGEDSEQSLRFLVSSFEPGGVLEIAYNSDMTPNLSV